jgi:uncharacterized protein YjbI with pentapeptide repeats
MEWYWSIVRAVAPADWYWVGAIPLAVAMAAALWFAWWLWWRLPKRQVSRLSLKIRDAKARADTEDNFRKTMSQLLGGAAVLVGAGLAYLQFTQQQQASHDLLISNQVSKGFEQLGSDKAVVRLGGIYALEGVMNTSAQYHQAVIEALCAFVRDGTSDEAKIGDHAPSTEIQAALTVIGRRHPVLLQGEINLVGADIPRANLARANLSFAHLEGVNLKGANLGGANLRFADLREANLSGANLSGADMRNAALLGADLTKAKLLDAVMTSVKLMGANLTEANLNSAVISQQELTFACGAAVDLSPGLTLKPCAPK